MWWTDWLELLWQKSLSTFVLLSDWHTTDSPAADTQATPLFETSLKSPKCCWPVVSGWCCYCFTGHLPHNPFTSPLKNFLQHKDIRECKMNIFCSSWIWRLPLVCIVFLLSKPKDPHTHTGLTPAPLPECWDSKKGKQINVFFFAF